MCTTIGFLNKKGIVFGRTLEIGMKLPQNPLYVPPDISFDKDLDGKDIVSKYSIIGSSFFNIVSFGDGMNSAGLVGSANYYPKYASFASEKSKDKRNIHTKNVLSIFLATCKNIEEVRTLAKDLLVLSEDGNGEKSNEMHYFFMDQTGKGIVLEPNNGILEVKENDIGVMTNAPNFEFHKLNLSNYVSLTNKNYDENKFTNYTALKFGEGSGMLGIPGDFTPTSRFVRAAYFVSKTKKDLDVEESVLQAFRILSQFDIPDFSVGEENFDKTVYTAVFDYVNNKYYVKYHNNPNIQIVDINSLMNEKKIIFLDMKYNFFEGN